MITLKQLIEQVTDESTSQMLDELYASIKTAIEKATSEEQLINFMLAIRKKVIRLRTKLPDLHFIDHKICYLFRDNRELSEEEKHAFYSLGVLTSELLFAMRFFYRGRIDIAYEFLYKLRSLTDLRDLKNNREIFAKKEYLYSIRVASTIPRGIETRIYIRYQSADYIVFSASATPFYFYVVKYRQDTAKM
jgi:hypothetical protein